MHVPRPVSRRDIHHLPNISARECPQDMPTGIMFPECPAPKSMRRPVPRSVLLAAHTHMDREHVLPWRGCIISDRRHVLVRMLSSNSNAHLLAKHMFAGDTHSLILSLHFKAWVAWPVAST